MASLVLAGAGCGHGGRDGDRQGSASPRAGESEQGAEAPTKATRQLGPAQLAGRLVVVRFSGPELPAYLARALRQGRAAGVILFADNVRSPRQLRRLTRAVRRAGGARAVVCADQEGGSVRIVPWAPPARPAPQQAAAATEHVDGRASARALSRLGIDVVLAPVADVAGRSDSAMRGRAFGSEPRRVARSVVAAMRGLRAGGVAPAPKHFPGLGGAGVNTDDAPATIEELPSMRPWRAAIEAGAPYVMVGHGLYPQLDPERIASQSPEIVTRLLREDLGFRGAVITDSLEAAAVAATGSLEAAAERSVRAGADLLLTTGRGSYIRIRRHLASRLREDPALRARLEEAVARVARMRREG
jgi:beta-N-acetylhexosaminidase